MSCLAEARNSAYSAGFLAYRYLSPGSTMHIGCGMEFENSFAAHSSCLDLHTSGLSPWALPSSIQRNGAMLAKPSPVVNITAMVWGALHSPARRCPEPRLILFL